MNEHITGGSKIEITGNRSAVIDGCDGIVDYDADKVVVKTGRLTAIISGRNLKLKVLTENTAVIEGFIEKLEYSY